MAYALLLGIDRFYKACDAGLEVTTKIPDATEATKFLARDIRLGSLIAFSNVRIRDPVRGLVSGEATRG